VARTSKDDVDRFFDHGLHMPTRTFYLGDSDEGIDHIIAAQVVRALHVLDATDGPITIRMNSGGGDCYHGLAIYDAIQACRNEVTIVGYGHIMSMGLVVLQAGDHRLLMPSTSVMWHYGSDGFEGHARDLERRAKESQRIRKLTDDILLAKIRERVPGYTAAKLQKRFEFDTFMSAQDAVDLGLADAITET
jgi:ATP-dependent Clp protease protease subunit